MFYNHPWMGVPPMGMNMGANPMQAMPPMQGMPPMQPNMGDNQNYPYDLKNMNVGVKNSNEEQNSNYYPYNFYKQG